MKKLELNAMSVQEMNAMELLEINGGNVPSAYYMDDDVIDANGDAISAVGNFIYGFVVGFFD